MTVFRASSLAAVTSFVCSTRLKPIFAAHSRTVRRIATTWFSSRISNWSLRTTAIPRPGPVDRRLQELHAALDIERGTHALQRESQLDQRDGHGRLHADDDGLRVQDARHGRDVADHPAYEGIHHFQ